MTPKGWTKCQLIDICDLRIGGTPSRNIDIYWDSEKKTQNRWVAISDIRGRHLSDTSEYISDLGIKNSSVKLIEPGIPLMSFKLSIGRATIPKVPVYTNEAIVAMVPSGPATADYLYYAVPRLALNATALDAVKGKTLNKSSLQQISLLLPPLPEQRKIAAILSAVDVVIERTQAVIDQLQQVKKALMQELLTRGIPGRHTRFKQTEIGEVPEGWEVVQVGDVCEKMFVGIAQAATHAYVPTGGVPIIRNTNIKPNHIGLDDLLRVTVDFDKQMASKRLRRGDVLTARTGTPGISAEVPKELDGSQCFTLLVSRPSHRLRSKFLVHIMNSALGEAIVQKGQAGGAQQNLNVGVFQSSKIPLPQLNEQGEMIDIIESMYHRYRTETKLLTDLQFMKSALMSVILSGELRVKVKEGAA